MRRKGEQKYTPNAENFESLLDLYKSCDHDYDVNDYEAQVQAVTFGAREQATSRRIQVRLLEAHARKGDVAAVRRIIEETSLGKDQRLQDATGAALVTAYCHHSDFAAAYKILEDNEAHLGLTAYVELVKAASKVGDVDIVMKTFALMKSKDFQLDLAVFRLLARGFGIRGNMDYFRQILEAQQQLGVEVNQVLEADFFQACLAGKFEAAAKLWDQYQGEKTTPNLTTIITLLEAYHVRQDLGKAAKMLEFMRARPELKTMLAHKQVWSTALDIYTEAGNIDGFTAVYQELRSTDGFVTDWSVLEQSSHAAVRHLETVRNSCVHNNSHDGLWLELNKSAAFRKKFDLTMFKGKKMDHWGPTATYEYDRRRPFVGFLYETPE